MVRKYTLGRRGEAAEETRRRIVEATFALHAEQGVAATTMTQIAERAGVSVGTVYHHFATYDDAIQACGEHASALAPPPGPELFAGAATRAERIERLARASFERYERIPNYEAVRAERKNYAPLREFFAAEAQLMRELAASAIGRGRDGRGAAVVAALIDPGVWRALRDAGLSTAAAASQAAGVVNAWLDTRGARPG
ncbi:MAG: TetR/AcrR family transcriptional regulator [Alphaproteobacteria bacterium]